MRVTAGHSHTCGIRADSTLAWWASKNGKKDVPEGSNFMPVGAGHHHTCAIDHAKQLSCWGWSAWAQTSGVPKGDFVHLASGYGHGCAVRANGEVAC